MRTAARLIALIVGLFLLLESSIDRELPPWFSRGLAGVLSNAIVKDEPSRGAAFTSSCG